MNKFIILLVLLLSSCSLLKNNDENIKNSKNVKTCDGNNPYEQCEILVENNFDTVIEEKKERKKINWSENLTFSYCDNIVKYSENSEFGTRADFLRKGDGGMISKKIDEYNDENKNTTFPVILAEYCKTENSLKYIFSTNDKRPLELGMYDKGLDIIEKANFKYNIFNEISFWARTGNRNYGDTSLEKYYEKYREDKALQSGFGKKEGIIVNYVNYGVSLIGHAEIGLMYGPKFLNDWNLDYCTRGLTPAGKLSVCFADVYYKYDLSTNTLYEDKVCPYYIDDNGIINSLQKCFQNTWKYKGYEFISGTQGINIYQNKSKDLSIIDIDLDKSGISFGGVIQTNTKYLDYNETIGYINKRFMGQLQSYNLQKEKDGSNFDNFKRQYVNEVFGENNFLNVGGDNKIIFAVVNSQFFNANKDNTTLSFPVKSDGKILNSYVDNDKLKKTVIVDVEGNIKILEGYDKKYLSDKNNREVLVGINPSEDFSENSSLGRTYMGVIGEDKVVFFIAKSKTQNEMKKIALDYGIEEQNLVMFDGGPSSQFAYFDIFEIGGGINNFYGGWKVPHFIMVYKK